MSTETAVLIPTYNRKDLLARCLDSLAAQTYRNFAIVVADDASTDGTAALVHKRFPDIEVLSLPENRDFAHAVNEGLRHILAEYRPRFIAVLNNDTVAEPEWLGALVSRAKSNPKIGAVTSNMFFAKQRDIINSQGGTLDWNGDGHDANFGTPKEKGKKSAAPVFSACWGAALISTVALENVGLLDERFGAYFEDLDWSWRARLLGYEVMFEPNAVVYHEHSASHRDAQYRKLYLCKRNALCSALKNYGSKSLPTQLSHIFLGYWFAILGYFQTSKHNLPFHKKFAYVSIPFAALGWNIAHLIGTLAARRTIQKRRTVPDDTILAATARDTAPVREWLDDMKPFKELRIVGKADRSSRVQRFLLDHGFTKLHSKMYLELGILSYFTGRAHAWYNRRFGITVPDAFTKVTKTFGVNIFGFLDSESGIGEAARSLIRSVSAARIPYALLSSPHTPHRKHHREFSEMFSQYNPYPVNLIAINGDMLEEEIKEFGSARFHDHYNVACWTWELERLSPRYAAALSHVQEVWAPSTFVADAVRKARSKLPVTVIPYPVVIKKTPYPRSRFRLPQKSFLFLFTFDFYSVFERKNPLAVVKAFRTAFPASEPAALVIKCSNAEVDPKNFTLLQAAAAKDARIHILSGYLERDEINSLLNVCDCFVSLHRSEGFGFGIAEAMLLRKPVIATDYSGNTDFLNEKNGFPVKYALVPLEKDYGPYRKGNVWAEPDIDDAAKQMRLVYENRDVTEQKGVLAARTIIAMLDPRAVGSRVRKRLEKISPSS